MGSAAHQVFVISRQRESEKRQIDGDLAHVALTLERRGWKEELMMANLERDRKWVVVGIFTISFGIILMVIKHGQKV